jgi:hypothetical protein
MEIKKYRAFGQVIETSINFDDTLPLSDDDATVVFLEKEIHENTLRPTRIWRKGTQATYHKINDKHLLQWNGIAKFCIENETTITYQNLGCDAETLKLFIFSEAFGIFLWQKGIFLLHGSAIEINGNAYVFVGVPGAGKSTTATALWQAGHLILTDDLVAIQLIDNEPFVIPALPQLKVWRNGLEGLSIVHSTLKQSFEGIEKYLINQPLTTFPSHGVPLKRITLLQKPRSRQTNGKISPLFAPIELVKHFPLPARLLNNDSLKKHFEDSLKIAKKAEIIFQKRPKDFDSLKNFVKNYEN